MKRFLLIACILISLANLSHATDSYGIGDKLFIWAKNGLNLRSGPGTQYDVLGTYGYGAEVIVTDMTEIAYNVNGISGTVKSYYNKVVDPIIFKGKWVKVKVSTGEEGYCIDQYLLSLRPFKSIGDFPDGLNLEQISIDTIFESPTIEDGSHLNRIIEQTYIRDIRVQASFGGSWHESTYSFPNLSIEEALILLSYDWNDYENFIVVRNWKEEIILKGEMCDFKIITENDIVKITIMCSC